MAGVTLTRIPFLFTGYGADADAWRVAHTAGKLWDSGTYNVSRFPGYPLHEIISAPFVGLGGAPLSNAATLFATLLLVLIWKAIAERHGNHPRMLVAGLAFAPQLWENSAATMDYNWSLLFLTGALFAGLKGKTLIAGLLLGVAAGFRPMNIAGAIPLAVLMRQSGVSWKQMAACAGVAAATTLAAFTPVMLRYTPTGAMELTLRQTADIRFGGLERFMLFAYRSVWTIGPLAAGAACVLLWKGRKHLKGLLMRGDPIAASAAAGLAVFLGLYLAYPIEREYLIPAMPFLMLLLDRTGSPRAFGIFTLLLISFSVLNPDVIKHAGARGTPGFNVHGGSALDEWEKRRLLDRHRSQIASLTPEGKAVVMAGAGPVYWFENEAFLEDSLPLTRGAWDPTAHFRRNPEARLVDALTRDEARELQARGYRIWCFAPAAGHIARMFGYSLENEGIGILPR
ncbi:MAG: hypothetical protein WB626_01750 [Bacteroidota bacterium]